jgi:hypothetical protein
MGFLYGKKARTYKHALHMSALASMAGVQAVALPESVHYARGVLPHNTGMMLNDTLGDCTCAGVYHARQTWTFHASGKMDTESDHCVLNLYEQACGYVDGDTSTDNGGDEQDVLGFLKKTGYLLNSGSRDKISGFVQVDQRVLDDVKRTIYECGVAYIGFNVPESLENNQNATVWDVVQGQTQSVGGHCVILTGYDSNAHLFDVTSWGSPMYQMTEGFFSAFTDEVWAINAPDWFAATGKSILGIDPAQLAAMMPSFE